MKEELFRKIGEIETNETACDKAEIERMYKKVMQKRKEELGDASTQTQQRETEKTLRENRRAENSRTPRPVWKWMVSLAATAAVFGICVYSYANQNTTRKTVVDEHSMVEGTVTSVSADKTTKENVTEHQQAVRSDVKKRGSTENNIDIEPRNRLIVSVYAAKSSQHTVDVTYKKTMQKTKVAKGKIIDMGSYNPLSSTVPGYPIMISEKEEKKNDSTGKIRIEVDGGELLRWNQNTGVVTSIGKTGYFDTKETIYWSPIEEAEDTWCSRAQIKMQLITGEKTVTTATIQITETKQGTYTAEKIK